MKLFLTIIVITACVLCTSADVSHLFHGDDEHTPEPHYPPKPYQFKYTAGRAPGHVDRAHEEVSDGSGVVKGAFSYIDPKNEVRTVEYVADEHGFHPQLSHNNEDTEAVELAKKKHLALYDRIAEQHAHAHEAQKHGHAHAQHLAAAAADTPEQSEAVQRATHIHLSLFDRIAAEHAAIGAQQEAERKALEAEHGHSIGDGLYHEHVHDDEQHAHAHEHANHEHEAHGHYGHH